MPRPRRSNVSSTSTRQEPAPHETAPASPLVEQLTKRELEVLALMADGLFNREISDHLCLAHETVKTHVHRVLTKLNAHSRAHAVAIGLRRGLIE